MGDRAESLPSRGAWIEITVDTVAPSLNVSLPSRGAWIEIEGGERMNIYEKVAPLTGSVD